MKCERESLLDLAGDAVVGAFAALWVVGLLGTAAINWVVKGGSYIERLEILAFPEIRR